MVTRVRRHSRLRAAAVCFALSRVRELAGLRETHKDYLVLVLAYVRQQLAAIGAELAERGMLARSEVEQTRTAPSSRASTASPRVVGVADATGRITAGQQITVNGATGRIDLH